MQHIATTKTVKIEQEIIPERRIYAQMRPCPSAQHDVGTIQNELPKQPQGRMIGPEELHLTLIHFGKADDVYEKVRIYSPVTRQEFDEQLTRYITTTTAALPRTPIDLEFDSYDLFGPKHTALVAKFALTETISALHAKLFALLVDFFDNVKIKNPIEFIKRDNNFKYAMTCEPHMTLFKGYVGELPKHALPHITFESLNVEY